MKLLDKVLDQQIQVLRNLQSDMKALRKELAGEPTEFDFKSVCETMDRLLEQRNLPGLGEHVYRQWGITGGESMEDIYKILDEWVEHVNARGKDEV